MDENNDDWTVLSCLEFEDGTMSCQALGRGTREHCIETAELINAISYSGEKAVRNSSIRWWPTHVWEEFVEAPTTHPLTRADVERLVYLFGK